MATLHVTWDELDRIRRLETSLSALWDDASWVAGLAEILGLPGEELVAAARASWPDTIGVVAHHEVAGPRLVR
jgi:hypothetical protein